MAAPAAIGFRIYDIYDFGLPIDTIANRKWDVASLRDLQKRDPRG